MVEALVIVKNLRPMQKWYGVFASGHEDIDIFEERLRMSLDMYNVVPTAVETRIYCGNSVSLLDRVRTHLLGQGTAFRAVFWYEVTLPTLMDTIYMLMEGV
jgi:hypothetical protein